MDIRHLEKKMYNFVLTYFSKDSHGNEDKLCLYFETLKDIRVKLTDDISSINHLYGTSFDESVFFKKDSYTKEEIVKIFNEIISGMNFLTKKISIEKYEGVCYN